MFYVIAAILIIICASVIFSLIVRKFPQLTLINTEHLPQVRDAKRKKAIIDERVSRMTGAFGRRVAEIATMLFEKLRERFRAAYRRLLDLQRQYRHEKAQDAPRPTPVPPEQADAQIAVLMNEAEDLVRREEFGEAEQRYISVLSLHKRNADAYRGLGEIYFATKRYDEAKETFAYLARMLRKSSRCAHGDDGSIPKGMACAASAGIHHDVAACYHEAGLAAQAAGELPEARLAFAQAAAFEPANPRHLDLLLDACILEGDKSMALQVFAQLRDANPENQKLGLFAERIKAMDVKI